MKTHKCTWRTVRLVLLIILLAVSFASASNVASKASVAADRAKSLEERMGAILDLGASADESAASILLEILRDNSEETRIRTSAVLALTKLGTPRSEIIKTFESVYNEPNSEKNFRYTILLSLGRMKAVESLSLLSAALSSEDSMIRLKTVQALGALENEDAMQILANHLTKEEDHMVRAAAIRSAGQSQTSTTEDILAKSLCSDSAPLVRNNAAIMLGKFKELRPETKAALASARDDVSPTVRATVRRIQP
ncbi:MAG: HEAT repeat domain-containing protein [Syntrophaceae bacterium]